MATRVLINDMMSDVYIPKEGVRSSALYLLGFPKDPYEDVITETLQGRGVAVVQPQYVGTHDSLGAFTPQNAIEGFAGLQPLLSDGGTSDLRTGSKLFMPPKITSMVAMSFGCFIALRILRFLPHLRTLVLLAPALSYGPGPVDSGFISSGIGHLDYMRRARPRSYRLGDQAEWDAFYSGALNEPSAEKSRTVLRVLGAVGSDDPYFDVPTLQQNFESLVSGFVAPQANVDFRVVPSGVHRAPSLFVDDVRDAIS